MATLKEKTEIADRILNLTADEIHNIWVFVAFMEKHGAWKDVSAIFFKRVEPTTERPTSYMFGEIPKELADLFTFSGG